MRVKNILVFPGGTENGLEIFKCLTNEKKINLFSVSSNVSNHSEYIYKNHSIIPDVFSGDCLFELNKIIKENKIDLIFPANTFVIDFLNKNKKYIKCDLIIPNEQVLSITRSKKNTYDFFKEILPVPKIYPDINEVVRYPVFVKPNKGYGSQGAKKIDNFPELDGYNDSNKDYIITEYLSGKEYTIDCFSSKNGGLLFCSGRIRNRIRMGTSMNGKLLGKKQNKIFNEYALKIYKSIGITGAWFFQMKEDSKGNMKLLEIEARIAGTMALNRVRGINFALLAIFEKLNLPFKVSLNEFKVEIDRSLKNRYKININYDSVYIDLDDTIIVKGYVNKKIISFLYQCLNKKIKLILITKSLSKDLSKELKKYRISEIFDEIIWLKESDKKADFINNNNSIFIDDSFSQRVEVKKLIGIPTFDPSMVEVLFDDKQ